MVPDRPHHPNCLKGKRLLFAAIDRGDNIGGQAFGLGHGVLSGWRAGRATFLIDDKRTVAKGPNSRITRYFEIIINSNAALFLFTWQGGQHRIRRRAHGGDDRLGGNALAVVKDRFIGRDSGETSAQTQLDLAAIEQSLGIEA